MIATTDAANAVQVLTEAAQLIREDPLRRGNVLHFGSAGQLVMTGDLHGNRRNFEKLQRFCALERSPGRIVILHELIHEEPARPGDPDFSIDLLLLAAAWKCAYPDNVFFLQSNHELAQYMRQEITKGGRSVLLDFERGVAGRFGAQADAVLAAVDDYIAALPLAAKTGNGLFLAHSLPDPAMITRFELSVFERPLTRADLAPGQPAYSLVWGRFQSPPLIEQWAQRIGAELCIVGHTPQETGYDVQGRLLILASDHAHGVFLPVDLGRRPTMEDLEAAIRKFVSVE